MDRRAAYTREELEEIFDAENQQANLRYVNLRGADLTGARFYEANWVGAIADNLAELLWRSQQQTDL